MISFDKHQFSATKKYPANFVLKKPGTIIGKLIRKWKWHYTKQHIRVNWPTKLDKINLQKLIVNIKLNTLLIIQNLYIANEQIEFGKAKVASESHYLRKNIFQRCEVGCPVFHQSSQIFLEIFSPSL